MDVPPIREDSPSLFVSDDEKEKPSTRPNFLDLFVSDNDQSGHIKQVRGPGGRGANREVGLHFIVRHLFIFSLYNDGSLLRHF